MPNKPASSAAPQVRKGQAADSQLSREQFAARVREHFYDPAFDSLQPEIERLIDAAWNGYDHSRKSPRTRKAGSEFADPNYDLSIEWYETRRQIQAAEQRQRDPNGKSRVLLICGSARNDQTCPGEMSKTFRLTMLAEQTLQSAGVDVDRLDLSHLNSEYGRRILPCKACVSTAMPLCHWPCSCYPNHSLGQVNDWMNELYPRFVAAHGIMIVTPVYWYQAPAVLKLLMDRLVCADGGNPDPTTTHGKDPEKAKEIELAGWDYPRHLAGRAFAVVVHGDAAGAESLRRGLSDWLQDMALVPSGHASSIDRYVGYYEPYATSHDELDADAAFQEEVRNAARALSNKIRAVREGASEPDARLANPRPK
jgi:multimeric flavodoxin WrbA